MAGSRGFHTMIRNLSPHFLALLSFALALFRDRLLPRGEFWHIPVFILPRPSPEWSFRPQSRWVVTGSHTQTRAITEASPRGNRQVRAGP